MSSGIGSLQNPLHSPRTAGGSRTGGILYYLGYTYFHPVELGIPEETWPESKGLRRAIATSGPSSKTPVIGVPRVRYRRRIQATGPRLGPRQFRRAMSVNY